MNRLLLSALFLATALVSRVAAQDPEPDPDAQARVDWLHEHAVKLKTVQAGSGFEDLQPLKAMIGDARIVGLGEGTHGTREYFQMKHRLFEFLATEMDFTIFAIEANMPEAYALDAYVLGGEGDVDRLIGGMYFWTWNTEEVRDLVEWMRCFNAEQNAKGSAKRLHFTGFDMQFGRVALRIVSKFLEQNDPEFYAAKDADLDRIAKSSAAADGFGCSTGRFPVEAARGKRIHFSGWIKTERVDAWAGLWWRVDGPTTLFDNMSDRGAHGTSDWQPVSIDMNVPADAQAIYFGLVMPGTGKAWFDALSIVIDGVPWSSPDFDLDFESEQPEGIIAGDPMRGPPSSSYLVTRDEQVAKNGKSSLRLERTGSVSGAAEARAGAQSILDHMTAARDRYVAKSNAKDVDWATQNARLLVQWTGLSDTRGGSSHRDRSMAENVGWILESNPGAKLVLWAHNWHVRSEEAFMGGHLHEKFGAQYVNLAFCASHGKYYAMPVDHSNRRIHDLAQPPVASFESVFESAGEPLLLLDLRTAKASEPGAAWLTGTRPFGGVIGAVEMPEHYMPTHVKGYFDLLIYMRDTTPARQLGTRPGAK